MDNEQKNAGGYNMTPEQKAKLKNFGKKNGLPEQKIQAQLGPEQEKPKAISQPPVIVAEQPRENAECHRKDCKTYFCCKDEEAGSLEIDLITFREKGVETRYLSMLFAGTDVRQEAPTQQEAFLNIESREEFERIKSFFAQLNWED